MTLEVAILTPALFLLIFAVIQGALWYHARTVALGAAQEGARVAAAETATAGDGAAAAANYISIAGGDDVLRNAAIAPSHTVTEARVTVSGQPPSVIPGWSGPAISQTAAFPVERFTTGP